LLIPRELLEGFDEVEIRKEDHALLVPPITNDDPILRLGKEPVTFEIDDASIPHDRYLYCA